MATSKISRLSVSVVYSEGATGIFDKKGTLFQELAKIIPYTDIGMTQRQDTITIENPAKKYSLAVGIYQAEFRCENPDISQCKGMVEQAFRAARGILSIDFLNRLEILLGGTLRLEEGEAPENLQPQTREFLGKLENRFKGTDRVILSALLSPTIIYRYRSDKGVIAVQTYPDPTKVNTFPAKIKYRLGRGNLKADVVIGSIEDTLSLLEEEFSSLPDLILK